MFPCFDQSVKKQKFRFSVIMNELLATTIVPYQVVLMGVINVLVLGQEDLRKREGLRREFLGQSDHSRRFTGQVWAINVEPGHVGQNQLGLVAVNWADWDLY